MEPTFVNDAEHDEITEDDLQDVFNDGYVAGLHQAMRLIEEQIEFHTATRQ